jgi:DNA-nicking Smr family endonuclease
MNLDSAWRAIDRGLEQAIERGRIRAAVNDWLAASRHASRIAAVRGAHRRHGGGGSLYLVLRRR